MDQVLRVGLVGAGRMGRRHARVLFERGVLSSLFDSEMSAAQEVAQELGRPDLVAGSLGALIQGSDAVVVATPAAQHFSPTLLALQAKKHVLVEKPICEDMCEAEQLVRMAYDKRVILRVGHVERFNRAVAFVRRIINSGEFGTLHALIARRVGYTPMTKFPPSSVVMDLGIHDIDLALTVLPPEHVVKHASAIGQKDRAVCIMHKGPTVVIIESAWALVRLRRLYLTLDRATFEVDLTAQTVEMTAAEGGATELGWQQLVEQSAHHVSVEVDRKEPLQLQLESFLYDIEARAPSTSGCGTAVAALDLALRFERELAP